MRKILLIALTVVVAVGIAVPMAVAGSAPKATGNVDFVYRGVTGNVTFEAQGTPTAAKGTLAYTNSVGQFLNGAVTSYNKINDTTAVFCGTITDGSPVFLTHFVAKVVDNGSSAGTDTIAIHVNGDGTCVDDFGDDHADVTSGNLTVHKG